MLLRRGAEWGRSEKSMVKYPALSAETSNPDHEIVAVTNESSVLCTVRGEAS